MMLLNEYCLIPDIFDINCYGGLNVDTDSRREICGVHLNTNFKIWKEECLIRVLYKDNTEEWVRFIKKISSKHPDTVVKILKTLKERKKLIFLKSDFSNGATSYIQWCEEAISSHKLKPLTGIIASKQTKNEKKIGRDLIVASIEKIDNADWWQERSSSVRLYRTIEDYKKHLSLILEHSNSLLFIDPYLNTNPDKNGSYNDFKQLLYYIDDKNPEVKLEIHVARVKTTPDEDIKNLKTLVGTLKDVDPEFFIWDDFHDRYLISDLIGINLPYGFGVGGSHKQKTTWTRLGSTQKDDVQTEFDPASHTRILIDRFKLSEL